MTEAIVIAHSLPVPESMESPLINPLVFAVMTPTAIMYIRSMYTKNHYLYSVKLKDLLEGITDLNKSGFF